MKTYQAIATITLRKGILDVQGKTVENALHAIEFPMIEHVRIGKIAQFNVAADDAETALLTAEDACRKLIANTIMEDFHVTISEAL